MLRRLAPLALAVLLFAPSLAAAGDRTTIDISLPISILARLGGTVTLDCDTDVDADTREMVRTLRHTTRYEKRDGDARLIAWHTGDRFRFRLKAVGGAGDSSFTLEMPWAAAECLFSGAPGRRQIKMEALERSGGFELRVRGDDGEVKVAVD